VHTDVDAARRVQRYLWADERLLWTGHPDPRVWFTPADVLAIPSSILWLAFAFEVERFGASTGGGPGVAVFAGILGIIGLYFLVGRFFYKRYRKKRTTYVITSSRALIVTLGGIFAEAPLSWRPVKLSHSRDGQHATVTFGFRTGISPVKRSISLVDGSRWTYANTGLDFMPSARMAPIAFYDVPDPGGMVTALSLAGAQVRA
jgi:hypothetical protein